MTRPILFWSGALTLKAAAWGASLVLYPQLPATVPVHWNMSGRVDGYGPKAVTLFLFPAFMIGMLGLFRALPALSPKDFASESVRSTYLLVVVGVIGVFTYLHGAILLATWQQVAKSPHPIDLSQTLFAGLFFVPALIGNVLGKIPQNRVIGVRVPWTLASERVWNDTHRLAAWSLVVGSILGFLIIVSGLSIVLSLAVLIASAMVPVVYSFKLYKQLERRGAL